MSQRLDWSVMRRLVALCLFAALAQAQEPLPLTRSAGAKERITLDDCYFKGDAAAKPRDIAVKRTAGTGVRVIVKAPSERPHNLAGADKPK